MKLRAIGAEDQIGLKLQAIASNPDRLYRDMADIRMLMQRHFDKLDYSLLREYFTLFGRQKDLESIRSEIRASNA